MMTVFETDAVRKALFALDSIADSLSEMRGHLGDDWKPAQDPKYCMEFNEWAIRLEPSDQRRLMNFLWNSPVWHNTCLKEEDAHWEDERVD